MKKYIFIVVGLILLFLGCTPEAPQRVEVRGIWLRPPETKAALVAAIDSLADAGINMIFIETWYHSHTIYPSKVAAQRPGFQGWDPLRVALRQARRRGVELHAWLEVLYAANPKHLPDLPSPLLSEHPDWLNVSHHPRDHSAEDGKLFLNPVHPGVRSFMTDLVRELAVNYKVDGIHLDYIRYPVDDSTKAFGYDPVTIQRMQEETGVNPWHAPRTNRDAWATFVTWKSAQITDLVVEIRRTVEAAEPRMALSAAVFADYHADSLRQTKCQDWRSWVQGEVLDFVATMCYAGSDSLRDLEMRESMALSRVPVVIGVINRGLERAEQIEAVYQSAMRHQPAGVAWFAHNWSSAAFYPTLAAAIYREPARPFAASLRAGAR